MISSTRIIVAVTTPIENRNIGRQYAIQAASWIWHPDCLHVQPVFLTFRNQFETDAEQSMTLHVSGDERYELDIDGRHVSMGPDRSDLEHWRFASYEILLEPGRHSIDARVWHLGRDLRPQAQISRQPGFTLCGEGPLADTVTTGRGGWKVAEINGIQCEKARQHQMPGYLAVGPAFCVDSRHADDWKWVAPVEVLPPVTESESCGVVYPGWALTPSLLPEQIWTPRTAGRVRAVRHGTTVDTVVPWAQQDEQSPEVQAWQTMLEGGEPVIIRPGEVAEAIVDLDDYYCGYATPTLSGGAGGQVVVEWAESLYDRIDYPPLKGKRNQVSGKTFLGFHDRFIHDGSERREHRAFWWRAGRYLRVHVRAANESLVLHGIPIIECRYPLNDESEWGSSDNAHPAICRMALRGIQNSLHETYTDTPYYEQMMYVGDTRLEALVTYLLTHDSIPPRAAIELFDYSRWKTGFTAERYPSDQYQICLPFSMIWVLMIRDFALYKDEPQFVRDCLFSVRQLLEQFRKLLGDSSLLKSIPGWSWIDWTAEWDGGVPPGGRNGLSAPINALFALCLVAAADLEEWHGEDVLAARNRSLAERVMAAIIETFWDDQHGLFADTTPHASYSEHAQVLALLSGLLDAHRECRLVDVLEASVCAAWPKEATTAGVRPRIDTITLPPMVRTTVYFSFYLHQVFFRYQRPHLFDLELNRWRRLVDLGLRTPIEDDSRPTGRSDCHAWGSHPLFHFHAGLAGVQPAEPGYRSALVAPQPGGLEHVRSMTPHPRGHVTVDLHFAGLSCRGTIDLPEETPGEFRWNDSVVVLTPGQTTQIQVD